MRPMCLAIWEAARRVSDFNPLQTAPSEPRIPGMSTQFSLDQIALTPPWVCTKSRIAFCLQSAETTLAKWRYEMEDELWIEKELERIRQEFNLTDEQFNRFREQRSLESQITQERIKEIHQLLESDDPRERHQAIVQIFAWVLDSVLRTFKLQWKGYEHSYTDLSERLLTMITAQERRLSKVEEELKIIKRRMGEAA
jgi:hypothetical protein